MLSRENKTAAATIQVMMKVCNNQLKLLAKRSGHEKIEKAQELLEHAIAEITDACLEVKKPKAITRGKIHDI